MKRPHVLLFVLLFISVIPNFASAAWISENAAKTINSWTSVPVELLTDNQKLIFFVIAPFIAAWIIIHQVVKEISIFQSESANAWLAFVALAFLIPAGFFKITSSLLTKTQTVMYLGIGFLAFLTTGQIRKRVGSFGYGGIFSGFVGYVLDAFGLGFFFATIGYAIGGGVWGGFAWVGFFTGSALGGFLVWWDKRKQGKMDSIKALMQKEKMIGHSIEELMKKADELQKKISSEKDASKRAQLEREFASVMEMVRIKKAQQEFIEMKEEWSA